MTKSVPIVDLFSGPGGLAEGFSAFRCRNGRQGYHVALSIEKDEAAYRTLRLRAFLRKFEDGFPSEYYEFLNGIASSEPNWAELYPKHWTAACNETKFMELGKHSTRKFVRQRVELIRSEHGGRTVLLGGPPCQSYSVVGRSRNAGNVLYNPDRDDRQSLYKEYAYVLRRLKPAVAVMENVTGMLSARHNGKRIFANVMRALARKSGSARYQLFALASRSGARSWNEGALPQDFVVHAEAHRVPQTRHRVFVVCIRDDIASALPRELLPRLETHDHTVSLEEIIGSMPRLRCRLSRCDSPGSWRAAVRRAHDLVKTNPPVMSPDEDNRFHRALESALAATDEVAPPCRNSRGGMDLARHCPRELRNWLLDENLEALPNNETRAHIPDDLARYLFVVAFGQTFGRSPKTSDFPEALVPPHASWGTGKFDDRYRVQLPTRPCTTVTSHLSKDGHYFIHPDPGQVRSLTVREVARLQTFPDNYFFHGTRTEQYVQVGNAVPPFLAWQLARVVWAVLDHHDDVRSRQGHAVSGHSVPKSVHQGKPLPLVAMETT